MIYSGTKLIGIGETDSKGILVWELLQNNVQVIVIYQLQKP